MLGGGEFYGLSAFKFNVFRPHFQLFGLLFTLNLKNNRLIINKLPFIEIKRLFSLISKALKSLVRGYPGVYQ